MPFQPGETLDWISAQADPGTAVFTLYDLDGTPLRKLTLANEGLVARKRGALHPVFKAPKQPGRYAYTFTDSLGLNVTGHVRVTIAERRRHAARTREPQADSFNGVRVRRA